MKVTRSYWLGLGSGLILSAMMTLIFSSQEGQAVTPQGQVLPAGQAVVDPQAMPPKTEEKKQSDSSLLVQPSESSPKQDLPSEPQKVTQIDWDFHIPKGASAEQIADLLYAQNFIKDKSGFLERAHQMGAERQFRAGSFNLSLGLTEEELINQLLKK